MSKFPCAAQSNAIQLESGDQRGEPAVHSGMFVNCARLDPSRLHNQIAKFPDRSDAKVTFRPSGENCGSICCRVDGANTACRSGNGSRESRAPARSRLYKLLPITARW